MNVSSDSIRQYLVLLMAIALAAVAPGVNAVVKNVTVVNADGEPLANQTVTIVFPDGTEQEEETDDDGILIYDFPEDGDYVVKYEGGEMAVAVSGGIPTWAWVTGGVVGGAAVIAGGIAIADDDDDPVSPGGGGGGGGNADPCSGASVLIVSVATTIASNPGGHPDNFAGDWEISCADLPTLALFPISTAGPIGLTFSCAPGTGGACSSNVDCQYNGISTFCELSSTIGASSWSGQMTAGSDGNLPGGEAITVNFDATL